MLFIWRIELCTYFSWNGNRKNALMSLVQRHLEAVMGILYSFLYKYVTAMTLKIMYVYKLLQLDIHVWTGLFSIDVHCWKWRWLTEPHTLLYTLTHTPDEFHSNHPTICLYFMKFWHNCAALKIICMSGQDILLEYIVIKNSSVQFEIWRWFDGDIRCKINRSSHSPGVWIILRYIPRYMKSG